jgi:hypothetical protein
MSGSIQPFAVRYASLLVLAVSCSVFIGCGKRGAPIPPRERVEQRIEIAGFQRGRQVILSWKMPPRNAPKNDVLNISRIDIYRLVEKLDAPMRLTQEEFADRSTLIAAVAVTDADFGLKTLSHRDDLSFAGQAARLRYAVRLVNANGQKSAFSNFLLIEPAARIASEPRDLQIAVSQDALALTWRPPAANVDGSTPASVLGFNVYRSTSAAEPAMLLNRTPVQDNSFSDETFQFGREYYYFVRAVSSGAEAQPVESAESNIVRITPKDEFAPSAPEALTVAAAPGVISVFWAVNPEKDISGYRIYRSTDLTLPKERWAPLSSDLLRSNTFLDTRVESGKMYHYYVVAVDTAGNTSAPSEVVSDIAP